MNDTPTSSTLAQGRVDPFSTQPRPGRLRRALALSALGVAGVAIAACGSSSSASTPTTTAPSATGAPGGAAGAGGGGGRQFPGASGTIAAINGTSLEVQNPTTGQTTVSYSSATTFQQTTATTASAVTVGSCISAFGKPTSGSTSGTSRFGGPVTATTVSVSQPVSGTCSVGFGGRPGGGNPPGGGTRPSTPGAGSRPAGAGRFAGGSFGAASGSVTSVNGLAVTITETNPSTKATSSVVVTLTAATTFTTTGSASPTDLAVGKCARANGSADSTGAIAARSITISTAGANGCTSGFGGFRGAGGGAGTGA
jgi:hypothetical protein